MRINIETYFKEYQKFHYDSEISNQNIDNLIQKANLLRTTRTPEQVIELLKGTFTADPFIYGSCGTLACLLDLLYGDDGSTITFLTGDESVRDMEDDVFDVRYIASCIGFDHVIWSNGIDYFDILSKGSLGQVIKNSQSFIDYGSEPLDFELNKDFLDTDIIINHDLISSSTSGELYIHNLLFAIKKT